MQHCACEQNARLRLRLFLGRCSAWYLLLVRVGEGGYAGIFTSCDLICLPEGVVRFVDLL